MREELRALRIGKADRVDFRRLEAQLRGTHAHGLHEIAGAQVTDQLSPLPFPFPFSFARMHVL
eukprot:COSAG05_NODE_8362_length_710_cov_2.306056_2_plen_63_part_00